MFTTDQNGVSAVLTSSNYLGKTYDPPFFIKFNITVVTALIFHFKYKLK